MQQQNHLFWRAGFGPTPNMLFQSTPFDAHKYWEALWLTSEKLPTPINVSQNLVDGLMNGLGELGKMEQLNTEAAKEKRQQMQKQSRQNIRNLNLLWLNEMVNSPAQLREKMSLFWHGHFACRNLNSFFQQQLLTTIRDNALGSFSDLLKAVSKCPAMLQFLNNQQNKKNNPNENFAREVMELFTLGRGNYTEKDIKESARAFTGWGFDLSGNFVFRQQQHDAGTKTVLGKTGNLDGDDVLDILLLQKQTAIFITTKIYKFFVNELPDSDKINWLANRFYESGYNIKKLMQDIFTAPWFYQKNNMGNHIKSPIELLVGLRRQLPMTLDNDATQLLFQKVLGQVLLYPPNVAGWPGGQNWIDGSSLMFRLRLPQLLASADAISIKPKNDDDNDMGRLQTAVMEDTKMPNRFRIKAAINWNATIAPYDKTTKENLYNVVSKSILQTNNVPDKTLLEPLAKNDSRASYISSIMILLMSTPEYQLC